MNSPEHSLSKRGLQFALFLLFLVSFFNYLDRYMLAILLPNIKADLDLSDTQLGFITGFAFTIFYATLGIPIARLADRYSRKTIISLALAVWSIMTAICGLAQNFVQLAVARVLVGVGEAGASPPSHSLIADYFPPEKRTRALSIFTLGAPVGILIGFIVGSWLATQYSWRIALFAFGIPGALLSIVIYWKLVEPRRGHAEALPDDGQVDSFWTVLRTLSGSRAFCHISLATGLYTVLWLGVVNWLPSFFTRSFGMTLEQVGFWLALVLGISQIFGMLASGVLTDRLVRRDARWYAWLPALAIAVATPMFAITFITENVVVAFAFVFLPFMVSVMQGPATFSAVQSLAGLRMRAMAAAVLLLVTNLVGGMFGTLSVGLLSDYFEASRGDESLRLALLIVSLVFGLWSALHYALASRTIGDELNSDSQD